MYCITKKLYKVVQNNKMNLELIMKKPWSIRYLKVIWFSNNVFFFVDEYRI